MENIGRGSEWPGRRLALGAALMASLITRPPVQIASLNDGKGESCADVTVGKEGTIRAQTVFDENMKAANHNQVGHVTLLR